MLLHVGDIYVPVLLHLLLTVSGPVVVGVCSPRGYFVVNYPSCQRFVSWGAHCCCSCHSLKQSARLIRHSLLVEDCRLFLIIAGVALCVVRV